MDALGERFFCYRQWGFVYKRGQGKAGKMVFSLNFLLKMMAYKVEGLFNNCGELPVPEISKSHQHLTVSSVAGITAAIEIR